MTFITHGLPPRSEEGLSSMQTQNTNQDPIATKASKRNVKCEIGKRTARVGKGETERKKEG